MPGKAEEVVGDTDAEKVQKRQNSRTEYVENAGEEES